VAAAQTDEHCSYCDGFPLNSTGIPELDHFQPKGSFPSLAFDWNNLYLACSACNREKLEQWDDALLRPDSPGYGFGRFFKFDTLSGALSPHPGVSEEDQLRARRTIEIFGLNRDDLKRARRAQLKLRRKYASPEVAYRFLFVERGA
jgi:uncharacterized protein (TIGR02646 family)